ncbi:hypothetical protein FAZ78_00295 [Cereibacter changlensis]|uniref:Uncharacterized protein n=1 Tax=Cereibacter changlensis TaxID=402884 RepID=A0A4U0Z003_9RHOB|nr:hypothetical protein [Cereibacter changlensis]TKA98532.1 hypothetical protein FAZ78_00295 [Cereibacter changlensis]
MTMSLRDNVGWRGNGSVIAHLQSFSSLDVILRICFYFNCRNSGMDMRRKAFCVVADIEPRRFDTMQMRGQLPFPKPESGWGEFTLDDAFKLRLMLDLVDNGGCDIGAAYMTLRMALTDHWLTKYPLTRSPAKADTWIALGSIVYRTGDEFTVGQDYVAGQVGWIHNLLQGIGERVAEVTDRLTVLRITENGQDIERVPNENADYTVGRIIMANASLAARRVLMAADAMDLPEAAAELPDFDPDGPGRLSALERAVEGWNRYVARTSGKAKAD